MTQGQIPLIAAVVVAAAADQQVMLRSLGNQEGTLLRVYRE